MKFSWTTLYVNNMEESIKFYTELIGLELVTKNPAGPKQTIAFLGKGETQIELIENLDRDQTVTGSDISWGFVTDNLEDMIQKIKDFGISKIEGPIVPNEHIQFIFIEDPNGMRIQIAQTL